jgi:hypothetical protein
MKNKQKEWHPATKPLKPLKHTVRPRALCVRQYQFQSTLYNYSAGQLQTYSSDDSSNILLVVSI